MLPLSCVWLCAVTAGAKSRITTALAVNNSNTFLKRHLPKDSLPHRRIYPSQHAYFELFVWYESRYREGNIEG